MDHHDIQNFGLCLFIEKYLLAVPTQNEIRKILDLVEVLYLSYINSNKCEWMEKKLWSQIQVKYMAFLKG